MAMTITRKMAADRGISHRLQIESAGLQVFGRGQRMDRRAIAVLEQRGYPPKTFKSRQFTVQDCSRFDLLLAMDATHLQALYQACPQEHTHKLHLFLSFGAPSRETEVPDPYYGTLEGFERVFALCEAGARGLLERYPL